jgi:hypothetical protein
VGWTCVNREYDSHAHPADIDPIFMRRPEYYRGPLFLTGVGLVATISLLMVPATIVLIRGRGKER